MENAGNTNLDTRCDNYKEREKERKIERNDGIGVSVNI